MGEIGRLKREAVEALRRRNEAHRRYPGDAFTPLEIERRRREFLEARNAAEGACHRVVRAVERAEGRRLMMSEVQAIIDELEALA